MDPSEDNECNRLGQIVPDMAGTFKALGDLTRLRIIYLLSTDMTGTLGVGDLATRLGITQPAISQALKLLKGEGLVDSRREGFYVYYTINRERIIQFRDDFTLMYGVVMENCDREFVRKTLPQRDLNACLIFFSYTGVTRAVAQQVRNACWCDLVEVKPRKEYSAFSAYTIGALRSRKGECDAIIPETIDVSGYDLIIIGTPVWAWKPTPAINAAVAALRGCEGKRAVIFTTSCGQPGEALPLLRAALVSRGVIVVAESTFTKDELERRNAGAGLIGQIVAAYTAPEGSAGEHMSKHLERG